MIFSCISSMFCFKSNWLLTLTIFFQLKIKNVLRGSRRFWNMVANDPCLYNTSTRHRAFTTKCLQILSSLLSRYTKSDIERPFDRIPNRSVPRASKSRVTVTNYRPLIYWRVLYVVLFACFSCTHTLHGPQTMPPLKGRQCVYLGPRGMHIYLIVKYYSKL